MESCLCKTGAKFFLRTNRPEAMQLILLNNTTTSTLFTSIAVLYSSKAIYELNDIITIK